MSIDRISQPTQKAAEAYEPDRDVIEQLDDVPDELPDDADPGDAYEQTLVVDAGEDDYR